MSTTTPEHDAAAIIQVELVARTGRYRVVLCVTPNSEIELQKEFISSQRAEAWAEPVRRQLGLFARVQGELMKQVIMEGLGRVLDTIGPSDAALAETIARQIAATRR
jgi:hypothetical protein